MRRTRCVYPIIKIPWRSFSTWNIRNSRRRYIGILDDGKVRHGILMQTYWEYSSHLRRKLGKGKYLFSLPNWENHFLIFLSCIFVNYKYLLEEGGEGIFYFDSTYASEKQIDRDKFNKRFLKFKHSPALDSPLAVLGFKEFWIYVQKISLKLLWLTTGLFLKDLWIMMWTSDPKAATGMYPVGVVGSSQALPAPPAPFSTAHSAPPIHSYSGSPGFGCHRRRQHCH